MTRKAVFHDSVSGDFDDGTPLTAFPVGTGTIGPTQLASTGVTAATYGDATHVAQVAVDADGRITSAANVTISGSAGSTWSVLTDGVVATPALVFAGGDVIMVQS